MIKLIQKIAFLVFSMGFIACMGCDKDDASKKQEQKPALTIAVPLGGNTWVAESLFNGEQLIKDEGIRAWSNQTDKFRVYFKLPKAGELHVGLKSKIQSGKSLLKCTINGTSHSVEIQNTQLSTNYVGAFNISEPGYHYLEIEGLSKDAGTFAEINELMLGGEATVGKMYFVKDEFYWGRRGPSVHLSYKIPEAASGIEYFYNEVTVPQGQDVIGSYYMANGFGQGYFGIQVNSASERRVLFSVWSPYQTDDPSSIPDEDKIKLVRKGDGVYTGEFGNEGSGGQSYLKYKWITGNTYQFLLKGQPLNDGYTQFTAWFKGPELNDWKLIASFKRPKIQTWLTSQYSFLENFHTETGAQTRMAYYDNQWVCDNTGQWYELTEAKFTADATARKESRLDYAGGVKDGRFFMKNCGFFNETTTIDSQHQRPAKDQQPIIDFSALP
jgi:hypothetical protein